ncbi:DUF1275 domain-containing protein [Lactobacillus sp. CBA3605]|uniref:YoaK family protein n=1 Tax=Lactobacillus sp. CBA3605 TaxID=2099788 RepID=UPI000CFC395E|nr:YoaK family protein [Lactobacillus sp. CBA3605]AVK60980.1 DUF1275 domain-containing protein [Lactobacillus sp. CBA3605]
MKQRTNPAREQLLFSSGLMLVAGALEAYTYLEHGTVFAGFQMGNLILFGLQLGQLNFTRLGNYIVAMLAFMLGTLLVQGLHAYLIRKHHQPTSGLLWSELLILLLTTLLMTWLPEVILIGLLALAAAVQVQIFHTLKTTTLTSSPLTDYFRMLAAALNAGIRHHDQAARVQALDILIIMGSFGLGAVLIGLLAPLLKTYALLGPVVGLLGLITWRHQRQQQRQWKH